MRDQAVAPTVSGPGNLSSPPRGHEQLEPLQPRTLGRRAGEADHEPHRCRPGRWSDYMRSTRCHLRPTVNVAAALEDQGVAERVTLPPMYQRCTTPSVNSGK